MALNPTISRPVGNRVTPAAQGRESRMEAFQLIQVPQDFPKLLQTNKLSSVVGLGKACGVPVQSLWPAAVPKVKKE